MPLKKTEVDYRKIAILGGGKWIDKVLPKNTQTKTLWQCNNGHPPWLAKYNDIQQGNWCPYCAGKKTDVDYHLLAKSGGGFWEGLELPKDTGTKTLWQCAEGHPPWEATFHNIQQGYWCPYCAGLAKKIELDYHDLAEESGGYWRGLKLPKNVSTKTIWQCAKGHPPWEATYANIQQGKWCPHCAGQKSKPEETIHSYLLPLFPDLLRGKYGILTVNKRFQLDIYSLSQQKAIEYDGPNHYKPMHGEDRLKKNQDRDSRKNTACLAQGIKLLRIDHRDYEKDPGKELAKALAFMQEDNL